MVAVGAFYVTPGKIRFDQPVEISIPLAARSRSGSSLSLRVFDEVTHAWKHAGPSTTSDDGARATVDVEGGGLFVFALDERKWTMIEEANTVEPAYGSWTAAGTCLPPGPVMSSEHQFDSNFDSSPSLNGFPEQRDLLYRLHGGSSIVHPTPVTTVPSGYHLSFEMRPIYAAHTRNGKIWYDDTPNVVFLFQYFFLVFDYWEFRITKVCEEDQGGIWI